MKIALASAPVKNLDVEYNLSAMATYMEHCKNRADIILFGESVLQGFECLCWDYEADKLLRFLCKTRYCGYEKRREDNNIAVSFGFVKKGRCALQQRNL